MTDEDSVDDILSGLDYPAAYNRNSSASTRPPKAKQPGASLRSAAALLLILLVCLSSDAEEERVQLGLLWLSDRRGCHLLARRCARQQDGEWQGERSLRGR